MEPLRTVAGRAYPLGRPDVDTDTILPAAYLKTITRTGLARGAFEALRRTPGNVFDDPAFAGAPILIAGANFGCGSSREHAAWALLDLGIRAVIAPSFADLFASNAFKNGIVTVELSQPSVDRLTAVARGGTLRVDLETMTVTSSTSDAFAFTMDPFRRESLLLGRDEIALTLGSEAAIARHEASGVVEPIVAL
ncbi:3-isopropylmalate dehydratase small subunit [Sphingomonas sp. HF-S4]|uniref:3-isopropylmalate dehydratase n=1 Tax=Sphingomonas agrestis TaxID=3080540 RepID=A0ABU3Y432_9SPHN|nr:3-isopropylmalate dehydratase small subunit [Sphingomonas sp. HF-S4]MDV3456118.1 3-isopropylmalate dehydratase small subunit [Sphingomonas sp. HF-S4]